MTASEPTPRGYIAGHTPVLLPEVLEVLQPRDGGIYVDGTFGAGGYSRALLEAADCEVWAIDRDPEAIGRGSEVLRRFAGRIELIEGRYGDMAALLSDLLAKRGSTRVQGVAFDVGVSSNQLDDPARGFSFGRAGPLDMRMSAGSDSREASAGELVNRLGEEELADVIHRYGEERRSRQVAKAIVAARRDAPIEGTEQLAGIVRRVVRPSRDGLDPATRTFQALRIFVNDELGELGRGLLAAERLLAPGGRLAVVSFHSLEDRRVKSFLRLRSGAPNRPSRHLPAALQAGAEASAEPSFRLLFKGARAPGRSECAANPRARSARLRGAERTAAAPLAAPLGTTASGARS